VTCATGTFMKAAIKTKAVAIRELLIGLIVAPI